MNQRDVLAHMVVTALAMEGPEGRPSEAAPGGIPWNTPTAEHCLAAEVTRERGRLCSVFACRSTLE